MIVMRMRATGHSRKAVTEAVLTFAPEGREKNCNWNRYAEKATDYAFGIAGEIELAQHYRFLEQWQLLEGVKPSKKNEGRERRRQA
jgi:hypothetical protein